MKDSLLQKFERLHERLQELDRLLGDPKILNDQLRYREIAKEHAELSPVVACFNRYRENQEAIKTTKEMLADKDPELRMLAQEELQAAQTREAELEQELRRLLLPSDPLDASNIFLELRAGTGGEEAALFVGDLLRMYSRYVELRGWDLEILSSSRAEAGGYKE